MSTSNASSGVFGRRAFLRAGSVLGLGLVLFGFGRRAPVKLDGDYLVINGWVLPGHYFSKDAA